MKAVIELDVPEWQIGQDVSVYFPDTMLKHGKCEMVEEQELVRCKDCKHGEPCKNGFGEDAIECFDSDVCLEVRCRRPDWFCADGESREGQ